MDTPTDHADLIGLLGGPASVAAALQIPDVNVRAWKMRNRIPPEHWPDLITMSADRLHGVSADWLMLQTPPRQRATQEAGAAA